MGERGRNIALWWRCSNESQQHNGHKTTGKNGINISNATENKTKFRALRRRNEEFHTINGEEGSQSSNDVYVFGYLYNIHILQAKSRNQ